MNLLIQEMNKLDLEHLIEEKLRKVLSEQFQSEQKKPLGGNYLSRSETAKLLKISLPTLTSLTAQSKLKSYRIGNRVLYKRSEIEESLIPIVKSKYKRK